MKIKTARTCPAGWTGKRERFGDLLMASWYGRAAAVDGVTRKDSIHLAALAAGVAAFVKGNDPIPDVPPEFHFTPSLASLQALIEAGAMVRHEGAHALVDPELWPP